MLHRAAVSKKLALLGFKSYRQVSQRRCIFVPVPRRKLDLGTEDRFVRALLHLLPRLFGNRHTDGTQLGRHIGADRKANRTFRSSFASGIA